MGKKINEVNIKEDLPVDVKEELPVETNTEGTGTIEISKEESLTEVKEEAPVETNTEGTGTIEISKEESLTEVKEELLEEVPVVVSKEVNLKSCKGYNLSTLESLYNKETSEDTKSQLLNLINSFKEVNGELELVMRSYK